MTLFPRLKRLISIDKFVHLIFFSDGIVSVEYYNVYLITVLLDLLLFIADGTFLIVFIIFFYYSAPLFKTVPVAIKLP